jgi:(1->4)-alpha-D-glucan 1-alpha-D-glucosylmutase
LSATSTHDTKRSEDVRARINVLSEIPDAWEEAIHHWHQMNQDASVKPAGAEIPDANEEYLFYQTLIGAWPLEPLNTDQMDGFVKRIQQYMDKAVKEAKLNTSWINVNEAHDNALRAFIKRTLEISPVNKFLDNFREFHRPIARAGMLNSLAQVAIKIASPGVADFYQGTELWDLSLVDPDNRRPVDYAPRREILSRIRCVTEQDRASERAALLEQMLARPEDGAIKMFVTMMALNFRSQKSELFARGEYLPLDFSGELSRHAIAFARCSATEEVVTVVGRFFSKLQGASPWIAGADIWRATFLGGLRHQRYRELFTGRMLSGARDGERYRLEMSQVFEILPVAMLVHDESL